MTLLHLVCFVYLSAPASNSGPVCSELTLSAHSSPLNLLLLSYTLSKLALPINTCDFFMPRFMSLSNVNMPCILLFRIVIIVLFYCGAPSPTHHASDTSFVPPPTHAVTSPSSITSPSRNATSYRHSMPRITSPVPAPYHTPVGTLCPESILPRPEICSFYSLFPMH